MKHWGATDTTDRGDLPLALIVPSMQDAMQTGYSFVCRWLEDQRAEGQDVHRHTDRSWTVGGRQVVAMTATEAAMRSHDEQFAALIMPMTANERRLYTSQLDMVATRWETRLYRPRIITIAPETAPAPQVLLHLV